MTHANARHPNRSSRMLPISSIPSEIRRTPLLSNKRQFYHGSPFPNANNFVHLRHAEDKVCQQDYALKLFITL